MRALFGYTVDVAGVVAVERGNGGDEQKGGGGGDETSESGKSGKSDKNDKSDNLDGLCFTVHAVVDSATAVDPAFNGPAPTHRR
jgi:hypothetical protein